MPDYPRQSHGFGSWDVFRTLSMLSVAGFPLGKLLALQKLLGPNLTEKEQLDQS